MKFPYSGFISRAPDTGDEVVIFRPEIPLRLHGVNGFAAYLALVDTGADNSMFPLSIARELGIETNKAKGPGATAFGGQEISLSFADIALEISEQNATVCWEARVHFFDFANSELETLVVGHQGFLDFFVATFDGGQMTLDLQPNNDMPLVSPSQ